jgi:hypothetical protein
MNVAHFSVARAICVCWAIVSDTRMAHGSATSRNGNDRPFASNQARMAARASSGTAPGAEERADRGVTGGRGTSVR